MGPWCQETKTFIDTVGKLFIKETGDIRVKQFLYQRIRLVIQQGDATSLVETSLPATSNFDEIYNFEIINCHVIS